MNEMYTGMNNANENMTPQNNAMGMPQDVKIDDKAVKKMAGEAISQVDGVLGVDGGLTDMLKSGDDVTKGLSVAVSDDGRTAQVSAKIITEYGKNIPDVVGSVQDAVAQALQSMAGLTADRVQVEVTDTMTREEYQVKNSKNRGLN